MVTKSARSNARPAKPTVRNKRAIKVPKQAGTGVEAAGFPIVGFGASAGGLESVTAMLKKMPSDSGKALVVVQPLDPKRAGKLVELRMRTTTVPVQVITDGVRVQPNGVYVIPPGINGVLSRSRLVLLTPLARNFFNLLPGGVGSQISDSNTKLSVPDLEVSIREVNEDPRRRSSVTTPVQPRIFSSF